MVSLSLSLSSTRFRVMAFPYGASRSHWHTTLSRPPLDEWQARRRDLWQHTTLTRDEHPCPRRDSKPQSHQADGHVTRHGHRDRHHGHIPGVIERRLPNYMGLMIVNWTGCGRKQLWPSLKYCSVIYPLPHRPLGHIRFLAVLDTRPNSNRKFSTLILKIGP